MQSFDELTRALAQGISRREALKLLAANAVAAMLAPFDGSSALAEPDTNECRGIPAGEC